MLSEVELTMIMTILVKGLWRWWRNATMISVQLGPNGVNGLSVRRLVAEGAAGGLDNAQIQRPEKRVTAKVMPLKAAPVGKLNVLIGRNGPDGPSVPSHAEKAE